MSLFKKNRKFEQQLQEQLGDMEIKPSESLWDRIDSNIPTDGFEQHMQHSLENFEQVPYSDTWTKIEAELPISKTPNGAFKYYAIALLALLFSIGFYFGRIGNHSPEESTSPVTQQHDNKTQSTVQPNIGESQPAAASQEFSTTHSAAKNNRVSDQNSRSTHSAVGTEAEPKLMVSNAIQPKQVLPKQNLTSTKNTRATTVTSAIVLQQTPSVSTNEQASSGGTPPSSSEPKLVMQNDTGSHPKQETQFPVVTTVSTSAVAAHHMQVTEVKEAKPDSVALAQKLETMQSTSNEEELTRFSISILAGAHMCYTTYASPTNSTLNFDENIAFRKQVERPDIDWSGGFLVDYRLSNKWMVSSGMMMTNFTQQFEYNVLPATTPAKPGEGHVSNPNDSIVSGNKYSNRIHYSWTEFPVFVNYTIRKGERWNIDIQAGASYAVIGAVDASIVSYDNKGVMSLKSKDDFPTITNAVFLTVMPQISYSFGEQVSLGLVPTVKYSANSIIGTDNWIQQHPYFVGLNMCLRKRF